jgi:hypothetical protein
VTSLQETIAAAERVLPGEAAGDGDVDSRWQAIIAVAEFIPAQPDDVWEFTAKWGGHTDADLRAAIATCLLEHLLETHFERVFPRVEILARRNAHFADTVRMCSNFGQAEVPANAARLDRLKAQLRSVV